MLSLGCGNVVRPSVISRRPAAHKSGEPHSQSTTLNVALFGHSNYADECPPSGVKRKWRGRADMVANDPKRTYGLT
jgi:hypothetical protein